jgi:FAD binding domain
VKLHILSRKTLGGIQTDLQSRALGRDGQPIDGLYAAGEVAGLGGGGAHGYDALEGTFLGGCLFSGRTAGRTSLTGSEHLTSVHHTTRRPARAAGRLDHHIPVRTRWPRPSSSHHGSWTGCPGARLGTEPLTGVLEATMPTLLIRPRAPGYSESPVPVPRTDGSLQGRRMLRLGVVAGRREPL